MTETALKKKNEFDDIKETLEEALTDCRKNINEMGYDSAIVLFANRKDGIYTIWSSDNITAFEEKGILSSAAQ